jgi:hypothetical protein
VGVRRALRSRAIWARLLPAACSTRIRSTTLRGKVGGRPDVRLRPGHTYRVTMGEEQSYPKIAKMHVEIVDQKS